jgi:hypothetical protein
VLKLAAIVCICLLSTFSFSQNAKQTLISSYLKTGAYSTKHNDVFSFSGNQASLARLKTFSAGAYSERKFMLNELTLFSASAALPTNSGNFGMQIHHYGSSYYGEMQGGLAYARKLNESIDVGVQFNYYNLQIAGYVNAGAVNFEAGALFHFTEQLYGGIHVYNPTSVKLGKNEEEKIPAVYTAGLGYDVSEDFFISTEIEKTEDLPLNVNVSAQYKFADRFLARGGVLTATSIYFLGTGFCFKNFRFDVMASVHPQLGVTPGLMLIYQKPAKN